MTRTELIEFMRTYNQYQQQLYPLTITIRDTTKQIESAQQPLILEEGTTIKAEINKRKAGLGWWIVGSLFGSCCAFFVLMLFFGEEGTAGIIVSAIPLLPAVLPAAFLALLADVLDSGFFEFLASVSALIGFLYVQPMFWIFIASWHTAKSHNEEYKIRNEQRRKDFEARQTQLPELRRILEEAESQAEPLRAKIQEMHQQDVLHPNYVRFCYQIQRYLEEGRADTIKEAIALCEHDEYLRDLAAERAQRHREIQQKLNSIEYEASRAANAAEQGAYEAARAADSADWAALWSAGAYDEARRHNQ